jgi:acyl carrier protein
METETLDQAIYEALNWVAPEVDPHGLDPGVALRDQIEMDSVDFLGFVLDLERRLGVKIPQVDYPKLSSLTGCATYLKHVDRPPAAS